jgi:hypothetical protein
MKIVKLEVKPVACFGAWEVYADGTLKGSYKNPSGRSSVITIYPDRLIEGDLIANVIADGMTTELNFLILAYFKACKLAGIKQIPNFLIDFE